MGRRTLTKVRSPADWVEHNYSHEMRTPPSPATFAFVTGHECGEATFRAILSLPEYGTALRCSMLVCLDHHKSNTTAGFTDPGPFATQHGIQVEYVRSIKTESALNLLSDSAPDYLMIVGWSELAPPAILDIPKSKHIGVARHTERYGSIGIHPSLLPEGRGRAPIPWAIIKGLSQTGVSAFLLEPEADSGGIVEQLEIQIAATETATTLFEKVKAGHTELGFRLGRAMATRSLAWTPQDERLASVWPRRRPEDGKIDFTRPAAEIDRLVRALTPPYPGAFFLNGTEKVRVHNIEVLRIAHTEVPGTIVATDPAPVIAVGDGAVRLTSFEPLASPLVAKRVLR